MNSRREGVAPPGPRVNAAPLSPLAVRPRTGDNRSE
jgi:hypothetical protein